MSALDDAPVLFSFENTEVRTFADDKGEMWFSAGEVCSILGYRNPRDATVKHCRAKGVAKRDTLTPGGPQELTFINEPNLYRLIVRSRKPEAERFEAWVMETVLPAIRKTGVFDARRGIPQITVPHLLSAQRHVCALLQRIKVETAPAVRRVLHDQLEQACRLLAIAPPALDEIGRTAVPDHESPLLDEFWDVFETLEQEGIPLNHARNPAAAIAINLPQVRSSAAAYGMVLPDIADLRRLLRVSRSPRFVAIKAVNSERTRNTVKCWVFAHDPSPAVVAKLPALRH